VLEPDPCLQGCSLGFTKGAGGDDLYPSLRAEFEVNKILGSSLDTFHTEPRSLRATEAVSEPKELSYLEMVGTGNYAENYGICCCCCLKKSKCSVNIGCSKTIQLFIKTWDKTLAIQVAVSDDVIKIKEKIYMKTNLSVRIQRLTLAGFPLNDNISLENYNIKDNSTLDLHYRLLGGSNSLEIPNLNVHFNDLRKLLSPIIGYFKGDEIPLNTILEETTELSEATGDLLNTILTKLLGMKYTSFTRTQFRYVAFLTRTKQVLKKLSIHLSR